MEKRRDSATFMSNVPGPSKILRPELPNAKALSGTVVKALRSNQSKEVGCDRDPFAMRFGRLASAKSTFAPEMYGVNG